MRERKALVTFTVNIPEGCSVERMKYYIKEAVESWSGQFNPDEDPLFAWFRDRNEIKPKVKLETIK